MRALRGAASFFLPFRSARGRITEGLRFAAVSNSYEGARHYIQSISKVLIGARQTGKIGIEPSHDARSMPRLHAAAQPYVHRGRSSVGTRVQGSARGRHAARERTCMWRTEDVWRWDASGSRDYLPTPSIQGLILRRLLVLDLIATIKAAFHPSSSSLSA